MTTKTRRRDHMPRNFVYMVRVKPKTGKNTRLQSYKKMVKGRPDMQPYKPKVTRTKGQELRVSGSSQVGKDDLGDGTIYGANGRLYYYVTNDPVNGNAKKRYVKESDVRVVGFGEVYTVKKKDNLTKIAKKIYFSADKRSVNAIYNANKDVIGKNKNRIKPGQKLFVPYNTH
jgi:hypothetical protein